jgi:TPR repeat protein
MKKAQDAAKQSSTDKAKPEAKSEVATAAPKAEASKQETAKAEPAKAETAAANPPEAAKREPKSRSEREAARDAEAAAKALAAAGKAPVQLASAAPTSAAAPGSSASSGAPAAAAAAVPAAPLSKAAEADLLYQQGLKMEGSDAKGAVRIYRRAARDGNGKAAKRLGELFDKGAPGVDRDYQEALSWYSKARELGETVELSGKR